MKKLLKLGTMLLPYRGVDSGNWTIGYGHVVKPEEMNKYFNKEFRGLSEEDASELLREDLVEHVRTVNDFAKEHNLRLSQHQFDALKSPTFNSGASWINDPDKQFITRDAVLSMDNDRIKKAFMLWVYSQDEYKNAFKAGGLYRRRNDEANMFVHGGYERTYPEVPEGYI